MSAFQRITDSSRASHYVRDVPIALQKSFCLAEIIDRRGLPLLFITGYGSGGRPEAFRNRPALLTEDSMNRIGRRTHHQLHAADRGARGHLESARSMKEVRGRRFRGAEAAQNL
jgi:hypothetical protein